VKAHSYNVQGKQYERSKGAAESSNHERYHEIIPFHILILALFKTHCVTKYLIGVHLYDSIQGYENAWSIPSIEAFYSFFLIHITYYISHNMTVLGQGGDLAFLCRLRFNLI